MVRSALTALALAIALIWPAHGAQGQDSNQAHVVAEGETLAFLADRYLGDHQRWPEIARLNPEVTDPDEIEPGVRLLIPASVMGTSGIEERISLIEQADSRAPAESRSVFYGADITSRRLVRVQVTEQPKLMAVSEDVFYSAEWLVPGEARPMGEGSLSAFVTMPSARRFQGYTARPFDRVSINLHEGFAPREGQELHVFRVVRMEPGAGWVVRPTGSLTVVKDEGGSIVGEVNRQFGPITLSDLVGSVPRFPLQPGDEAEPVPLGSMVATIVGWGDPHQLPQYGDIAFLDLGSRDGVSVGDEFVVAARTKDGFNDNIAGRLQVVRTEDGSSSARIIQMDGPVFSVGLEVFLAKKMR